MIDPPHGRLLFASDAAVENVHFKLEFSTVGQAVQKVVTSNVSDIFAMGGEPAGIVFTAGLPGGCGEDALASIVGGLQHACGAYDLRLFGGDTVRSTSGYFFDVAIIGSVEEGCGIFRRGGAEVGDLLVLFGECGGSLAGLRLLESISGAGDAGPLESLLPPESSRPDLLQAAAGVSLDTTRADIEAVCVSKGLPEGSVEALELMARHITPLSLKPAVNGSPEWASEVTAMIDISDGLAKDLRTLCAESAAGAVVLEEKIPVPAAVAGATGSDREALTRLAVSSGEEYVALAAVRREAVPPGAAVIGEITSEGTGVVLKGPDGNRRDMPRSGYEHEFGK